MMTIYDGLNSVVRWILPNYSLNNIVVSEFNFLKLNI